METYNFISKYESYQIPIQIIKLKDSFFIYIGSPSMSFQNLSVSTFNKDAPVHESSNCYTIYDDEYSEVGKSLAKKLSNKIF